MTTIAKALSLLELFSEARPLIGLSEFQRLTKRDKATVYRHLQALQQQGLIEQNHSDRAYRLGPRLERLADMRRKTVRTADCVAPIIDRISRTAGEMVHLSQLDGYNLRPLYHANISPHAIRVALEPDIVLPLLTTSSGKAMLAFFETSEAHDAIARQHATFGCPPMPDADTVMRELHDTARRGYASSVNTHEMGVSSVAIPVFDAFGRPLAACSIAYPTSRGTPSKRADLVALLFAYGCDLTLRLGGHVPTHLRALWDPIDETRKSA